MPWGIQAIGADVSPNKYDGKNIKIALIDTGVSSHEDLNIAGGKSFVENNALYYDDNGHGTHVAGIIAAKNNKLGVIGAAPNAEIYALKALDNTGAGYYSQVIAALEWAINNNIDIVNMSIGGLSDSLALHEAVQRASSAGIILVAAAGNRGDGADKLTYPAKYNEVIAVGAVNENLRAAPFSSKGTGLDIMAPGVSVISTANDGGYAVMSGTSMAAPHVAGALAALKCKNKKMSSDELKALLFETTTYLGTYNDYGRGLLNFSYAAGESNGPVRLIIPDDDLSSSEDDFNIPEPFDYTFDILALDFRLEKYKTILSNFVDRAYVSGDIWQAKEIDSKLQELILTDTELHVLPDNLSKSPKNTYDTVHDSINEVNEFFNTKMLNFAALEEEYIFTINTYADLFSAGKYSYDDIRNGVLSGDNQDNGDTGFTEDPNIPQASVEFGPFLANDANRDILFEQSMLQSTSNEIVMNGIAGDEVAVNAVPTMTIVNRQPTYVTFTVIFPTAASYCNTIFLYDFNKGESVFPTTPYSNNWYTQNGTYSITGLEPGGMYFLYMAWSTDGGNYFGGSNAICRRVWLPYNTTESLTKTDGAYISANMEPGIKSQATTANFNTWINRMDSAYATYKDLTGYTPYGGARIELKSTRQDFPYTDGSYYWELTWASAGNPALIATYLYKSHMLRLSKNDWGDAPLHEISHDFDNYRWNFDSEFFADFKEYYVVENMNATVYRPDTNRYYTGSGFGVFFRTDQMYSYSKSFGSGWYHSRGMVSVFIGIKNTIGWQPFKDTFRYFNTMPQTMEQSSNIGKLNLFLTKLRDYSGRDVIGLLSSSEKSIIQNNFGGTLGYVPTPPPIMAIGLNSSLNVSMVAGQYAIYSFKPATSGSYDIITSPYAGTGPVNDTYLELYSDAGLTNRIAFNDDFGGTLFSKITYNMVANTTYYILLRHYSTSTSLYTRITVQSSTPNATAISLNNPINVSLSIGFYGVYSFKPNTTGSYEIITSPYAGTGAENDTFLELYSDAGLTNRIAYNDDNGSSRFSRIVYNMIESTTYYIKLRHFSTVIGVHAQLTVRSIIPNAIAILQDNHVNVSLAAGQYAVYSFRPTVTGSYDIITSPYAGVGAVNDTYLELYSDASLTNRITYNDDYGNTIFSKITYSLVSSTTYYIKLRHYNANTSVYAQLTVKLSIPYAVPIILNNSYNVNLAAGQYAVYSFTPSTTDSYAIYTDPYNGTGAANDTYLELYSDADLTNRIAYNDDYNGTVFSRITYNMVANTTYYIKLRHLSTTTGIYARLTVVSAISLISTTQAYTLANYYLQATENNCTALNQSVLLYNETGKPYVYAVPFVDSKNNRVGHINIGARTDSPGFFIVDKFPINYSNISGYNFTGNKVIYKPPFWYCINTANPQLTGLSSDMYISENAVDDYDNYHNEDNMLTKMRLLDMLESKQTNTESVFTNAAHTIAMLKSESHPNPGEYVKISDGTTIFYGGNQMEWVKDPKSYEKSQKYMQERGCGAVAFANNIAYHIGKNYSIFGDLLKYTDQTAYNYNPHFGMELNPNYASSFTKRFMYDQVNKMFTSQIFSEFLDFYADLGNLPGLIGVTPFDIKSAYDYLKRYTGYNYVLYVPANDSITSTENYFVSTLNADIPILMYNGITRMGKSYLYVNDPVQAQLAGLVESQDFGYHWMTVTKYFRDGNTQEGFIAISTWGKRIPVNVDLLYITYDSQPSAYAPKFYAYELYK